METLISVIINVYNGEKFIKKCLDSVINQTYNNLEILIINDGSTDNTLELCEEYKERDKRIKIITQNNKGLAESRNVGIENSNGEYLYFVDVDDFISEDVIEYLYNLCKKYEVSMATCMSMDIYDYNYEIKNIEEKIRIISGKDMLKKILLSEDRAVTIWNKLFKKELFNNNRFENKTINDMTITHKIAILADKIAYSNQIKYYYLRHRESVTANESKNVRRYIDKYEVAIDRYNYIKNIYPNFIENEIGLIRVITVLYLTKSKEVEQFLKEKNVINLFRKLFSFKILFSNIKLKEKIKIYLFAINPKIYKFIANKYQNIRYKYKM